MTGRRALTALVGYGVGGYVTARLLARGYEGDNPGVRLPTETLVGAGALWPMTLPWLLGYWR